MQFKHPEVLYALFLLLIPIFIHLFQLRRFQKVPFTNVAYLKKATLQTRKSSQLKKWLTLLTRLLALACIILAFAQPFSTATPIVAGKNEIVLYVDNSFSMQAQGSNGTLFERGLQDFYENLNGVDQISWFTNDNTYAARTPADFKSEILKVAPTHRQLAWQEILLKANQLFSKNSETRKQLILFSDFQQRDKFPSLPEDVKVTAVTPRPVSFQNIAIDTAFISTKNASNLELNVRLRAQGEPLENVPVSLFKDDQLVAKTGVGFLEGETQKITFPIEKNIEFNGRITLDDPSLPFDNELFFQINEPSEINVLSISNADTAFLEKLFDQPEFRYESQNAAAIDYNSIAKQNFIVLNELPAIPASLRATLKSFVENGGSLFIIPPQDALVSEYNALLAEFSLGAIQSWSGNGKKITNIKFEHPLYDGVFEKEVANFQYPSAEGSFRGNYNATSILTFEDGSLFLAQRGNVYLTTSPWNDTVSNFQNSPLIVPTLYNMAQQSLRLPVLYYTIGRPNTFDVPVSLVQDEILTLRSADQSFIPLQQSKSSFVTVSTNDEPERAGNYDILKDEVLLQGVSFNFPRNEGRLQYQDPKQWTDLNVLESVENALSEISEANAIHSYWKWFVIFALLFLMCEMLILKLNS
ncbi:MAG: hypothetical protein CMC08_08100 [Flavobacteriaceae bacterium]|nr:hypothetical protein [Flavobacteriaceae bacterium]